MGLRLRVSLIVMVAMGAFAWLVIWFSGQQLAAAYEESARAEVVAIVGEIVELLFPPS